MARAPDARMERARALFQDGKKLIEISELLEIPEGTIRSWKNRYHWDDATLQKESQRCDAKKRKKSRADVSAVETVMDSELTAEQQLF